MAARVTCNDSGGLSLVNLSQRSSDWFDFLPRGASPVSAAIASFAGPLRSAADEFAGITLPVVHQFHCVFVSPAKVPTQLFTSFRCHEQSGSGSQSQTYQQQNQTSAEPASIAGAILAEMLIIIHTCLAFQECLCRTKVSLLACGPCPPYPLRGSRPRVPAVPFPPRNSCS
jgi:hypothetical protein